MSFYTHVLTVMMTAFTLTACNDEGTTTDDDTSGEDSDTGTTTPDGGDETPDTSTGEAPPSASYTGFEDLYILTDSDDPTDVCRVRFTLTAVAAPSVPCDMCDWAVVVEKSAHEIIVDEDGACANSALSLDDAAIAAHDGKRLAYGYVYEYVGHSNVLMQLDEANGVWEAVTFANWSEDTGAFFYDQRDGYCDYGTTADPTAANTGICGFSGEAVVLPE